MNGILSLDLINIVMRKNKLFSRNPTTFVTTFKYDIAVKFIFQFCRNSDMTDSILTWDSAFG